MMGMDDDGPRDGVMEGVCRGQRDCELHTFYNRKTVFIYDNAETLRHGQRELLKAVVSVTARVSDKLSTLIRGVFWNRQAVMLHLGKKKN